MRNPFLLGACGVLLALWTAVTATSVLAQGPIGADSSVTGVWVFQGGALIASALVLLKAGAILRDWKVALDGAMQFAEMMQALEARTARAEAKGRLHDDELREQAAKLADLHMLVNEHARRLGITKDYLDEAAG